MGFLILMVELTELFIIFNMVWGYCSLHSSIQRFSINPARSIRVIRATNVANRKLMSSLKQLPTVSHHEPVISKTASVVDRDRTDPDKVIPAFTTEFQKLLDSGEPWIASVKKDGSNGAIFNGRLYRRQDVKKKSRSYEHVRNKANGKKAIVAGRPCWVTTLLRGTGKSERTSPFYIFDVTEDGTPNADAFHIVGLAPVDHPTEDKWIMSAFRENPDVPNDPFIWASQFAGTLDVPVVEMKISQFMRERQLVSVELMCRKFADHNSFKDDRCFVSEHGADVIPRDELPTELTYEGFHQWFLNDATNRWANQEGVVFLFPQTGRRFKMHRGHFYMNETWRAKKDSGMNFYYA